MVLLIKEFHLNVLILFKIVRNALLLLMFDFEYFW